MPAARTRSPSPLLGCCSAVINNGAWHSAGRRSTREERVCWSLEWADCKLWKVPDTLCFSNVRVIRTTLSRRAGEDAADIAETRHEILPFQDRDSVGGRLDLRLTVPVFGRVYLHVLAWWLIHGTPRRRFASWKAFRDASFVVDHGDEGMPHICDWRRLCILPDRGARSNASQGARLRWSAYGGSGGLRAVIERGGTRRPDVLKKPAGRKEAALPVLKKPAASKTIAVKKRPSKASKF